VVFKPSELTPLSAANFVRVLEQAGLPAGVVNMVTGGPAIGELLTTHKDIAVVSFTGSTAVGRLVNQNAAPYFKKVHLEMGGKNCIMVMDDANLELALEGALWGGFGTTGQRCTAASRLIIHEHVHDRFVAEFVRRVKALRVGDGADPTTMVGPSISEKQLAKVKSYVDIGKEEGAAVACGGRQLVDGSFGKGHFFEPTVFVDVRPSMRIAREEIFGPVVAVMKCGSLDEAIAIGNDVEYGLSASIYTQDINRAYRAMREMYTGIFYVNAPTIGAEVHLPFGGTKATGNGHREAGTAALDVFSEWKSVYVDFSGKLQRAQIDNN
jgi:aldehyde dehydrogenase (NAD+)